jgi:glycosyltransferase involved in cell wall biosynthesis
MSYLLSICIPTYNRASCLFECLTSICEAISGYESNVEIIISDNVSTDNTEEVIKYFARKHEIIRCHRNQENIGGENNFRLVATLAEGKYIWVFGDDDRMEKNAIQVVLSAASNNYSIIICNYTVWTSDFNRKLRSSKIKKSKDEILNNKNNLLEEYHVHLSYISSIVVQKDIFLLLQSSEYEFFNQYGMSFMNAIYVGFSRDGSTAMFISEEIVNNRSGNSGNFNFYKYFAVGIALVFANLLKYGYSEPAISNAKKKNLVEFVLPMALYLSLKADYDRFQVLRWMFTYYKKIIEFWIIFLPIWATPKLLVRIIKNAGALRSKIISKYEKRVK